MEEQTSDQNFHTPAITKESSGLETVPASRNIGNFHNNDDILSYSLNSQFPSSAGKFQLEVRTYGFLKYKIGFPNT